MLKKAIVFSALTFFGLGFMAVSQSRTGARPGPAAPSVAASPLFSSLPLAFWPNRGQVDAQALFYARRSGMTLWLTKEGLVFDFWRSRAGSAPPPMPSGERRASAPADIERDVSRLVFLGANPEPGVVPFGADNPRVHFFIGGGEGGVPTSVPAAESVLYEDLYKSIDLKVYGTDNELEYDWIVAPGGNPEDIRFEYRDAGKVLADSQGDLAVRTRFANPIHRKPEGYQIVDGRRRAVETEFRRIAGNSYGFRVGPYDRSHPLFIDPIVLVSSTYLGGKGDEYGVDIKLDADGSICVCGDTASPDFPVKGGADLTLGGANDIFIVKFKPDGKSLVFATFLGGTKDEDAAGLALDTGGAIIVAGSSNSPDYPVKDGYDAALNGETDAVVTKLSAQGDAIVFSTYLGGSRNEFASDMAVDGKGDIYLAGCTKSPDFPVKAAYDPSFNGIWDAYVAKLAASGKSLVWSTFLGGTASESSTACIAVDGAGSAYVAGPTLSSNFPVKDAFDSTYNGHIDAFVTKFSPSGRTLVYSTFLGGSAYDWPWDIQVDRSGAAYVVGITESFNFPVKNAYDSKRNGNLDAFVTKLRPNGKSLAFSTYLGGRKADSLAHIVLDKTGAFLVTGSTGSTDIPLVDPYDKTLEGETDGYIAKFAPAGDTLLWSTLLGGNRGDSCGQLAVDDTGTIYLLGGTTSPDFPIKKAYDSSPNGGIDVFLARLKVGDGGSRSVRDGRATKDRPSR